MGDVIRLLDSTETKVIDSVACDYEDSFCLETFGDLCDMHRKADPKGNKRFIIARVQTWDPKQPDKAFFSYYNAFHLNKILFQTQNYLGKRFIHRLHVLNPLTNSDIIGNVQYFMVKLPQPEEIIDVAAQIENFERAGETGVCIEPDVRQPLVSHGSATANVIDVPLAPGFSGAQASAGGDSAQTPLITVNKAGDQHIPITKQPTPILAHSTSSPTSSGVAHASRRRSSVRLRIDANTIVTPSGRRPSELPLVSPSMREIDEGKNPAWTLASHSVSEAQDEEPAAGDPSAPMHGGARRGSLIPTSISRPIAYMKRKASLGNAVMPSKTSAEKGADRQRAMSLVIAKTEDLIPAGLKNRRKTEFNVPILTKTPTGPVRVHQQNKAQAPPGVITRFTVPVPKEELSRVVPKTYRGHRRSLSYANAVSASGSPASFDEWVRMVHEERSKFKGNKGAESNDTGDEYDVVKPFAGTPKSAFSASGREFKMLSASGRDVKLQPIADEYASPLTETPSAAHPDDPSQAADNQAKRDSFVEAMSGANGGTVVPMSADDYPEEEESQEDEDEDEGEMKIYDAVLFATDNDFLESSKTRAIFRENAIMPEDAKLFEMPAYTGEEQSPPPVEIVDDSLLCEWCYPSPQTMEQATPFMRTFHRVKCYLFAAVLAAMVFIFILVIVLQGSKATRSASS